MIAQRRMHTQSSICVEQMRSTSCAAVRFLTVAVLITGASASAQSGGQYNITKSTIDSGGHTAIAGGGYLLQGTIGQPDATEAAGGSYILKGGFWPSGPDVIVDPPIPGPDPSGIDKVRYVSFVLPSTEVAGTEMALQVKLVDLMNPQPANLPQFPPPNFSAFEGQFNYVGMLSNCQENESPPSTFRCATLQCAPLYYDFIGAIAGEVLHVAGSGVVPSSTYEVRILPASCAGNEVGCSSASQPLVIKTQRSGDVAAPFQNPGGSLNQPNITDVAAAVDKFKAIPGAIIVARGDVHPGSVNSVVNIADVAFNVDAFKGFAYPFPITMNCP